MKRKVTALMLSAALCLGAVSTAFAAESSAGSVSNGTITVPADGVDKGAGDTVNVIIRNDKGQEVILPGTVTADGKININAGDLGMTDAQLKDLTVDAGSNTNIKLDGTGSNTTPGGGNDNNNGGYPPNWTPGGNTWWNGTTPGTSDDKKDDAKDEDTKADAIMTEDEAAMIVAQFADVKTDSWFYDEILWAVQHGVMNGRSTSEFAPNASMTYLEVVTAMARYAGETIDGEDWASKALAWGIANGITDGSDSDALITRERLVTLLARLAEKQGMTLSTNGDLTAFPDNADLSDWAADAMKWAVGEGLINGMDGALNPKGNTTRAQVVTVLMRFAALAE